MTALLVRLTPEDLRAHVASLPTWDYVDDEDPTWVRPVEEVAGLPCLSPEEQADPALHALRAAATNGGRKVPVRDVALADVVAFAQEHVRLDALTHYLDPAAPLFDPDGWYGNAVPMLGRWRGGLLVLDGTHRVGAALIAGRESIRAHVVG